MTYEDLSIYKWQKIREVVNENLSDIDTQVSIISIIYGMSEEKVLALPMSKYNKLANGITFLLKSPEAHTNPARTIKINKQKYTIIKDGNEMTAAQFIDYNSWVKEDADANLHHILATFLVPKGKDYNQGYDTEEVAKDIQHHLDVQTAIDLCFFLQKRQKRSLLRSLRFSAVKAKVLAKLGKKELRGKMKELSQKLTLLTKSGSGFP